jgi:DNA-binding CsgD family transcriptional regulator
MAEPGKPRARRSRVLTSEELAEREKQAREMEGSVEQMAANGLTPQEISLLTGLSAERLYRKYKGFMMKGGAKRTNEVAEAAFQMAVGGPERNWRHADASMNKFWLERRGGPIWGPPKPDADAGPDLTRLSVAQLIELERALRPLARHPVLIDGETVESTEPRGGGGGIDEKGTGDLVDGGVGVGVDGSGAVPD